MSSAQLHLSPDALKALGERAEIELAERHLVDFFRQCWGHIDGNEYVHGRHIDVMAEHLQAVNEGEIRRLILNIPPRYAKTSLFGIAWPAWTWLRKQGGPRGNEIQGPQTQFLYVSHKDELAHKASKTTQRLIQSRWYQSHWGDRYVLKSKGKDVIDNDHHGARQVGVVNAVTGMGADILGIDDIHDVKRVESPLIREGSLQWFSESAVTRMNDPEVNAIVIVMQRSHMRDLTGYLVEQGLEHDEWVHVCLPLEYEPDHPHVFAGDWRTELGEPLWPERESKERIAQKKKTMGPYAAAGQLQQRPLPRSGGLFGKAMWQFVEYPPVCPNVRFWDFAATAADSSAKGDPDWTVGARVGMDDQGRIVIMHIERGQWSPGDTELHLTNTAEMDGREVPILIEQETPSAGKHVVSYYNRMLTGWDLRGAPAGASTTVGPLAGMAETGNVVIVRGAWNKPFLDEISVYPMGRHDDQVVAVAGAVNRLIEMKEDKLPKGRAPTKAALRQ